VEDLQCVKYITKKSGPRTDSITNSTTTGFDYNNLSTKLATMTKVAESVMKEKEVDPTPPGGSNTGSQFSRSEASQLSMCKEDSIYETPVEDVNSKGEPDISVSQIDEIFNNAIKRFVGTHQGEFTLDGNNYLQNMNTMIVDGTEENMAKPTDRNILKKEIDIQFFKNYYKQIFVRVRTVI
jgi:hypothetical protein